MWKDAADDAANSQWHDECTARLRLQHRLLLSVNRTTVHRPSKRRPNPSRGKLETAGRPERKYDPTGVLWLFDGLPRPKRMIQRFPFRVLGLYYCDASERPISQSTECEAESPYWPTAMSLAMSFSIDSATYMTMPLLIRRDVVALARAGCVESVLWKGTLVSSRLLAFIGCNLLESYRYERRRHESSATFLREKTANAYSLFPGAKPQKH